MKSGSFELAEKCLEESGDFGGLLLLATSSGNAEMISRLANTSKQNDKTNIAFVSYFLLGRYGISVLLLHTDNSMIFYKIIFSQI